MELVKFTKLVHDRDVLILVDCNLEELDVFRPFVL